MVKCTIAIPVYNREDFIRRAVDSALEQDVPDLEILVVDNCSTDHTWDVLHTYNDSRLRLVRNESNLGLIGNFNRCLSLAQGEYIKFLCSDDKLTPFSLSREIKIMATNSNVVMISSRGRLVDNNGQFMAMFADHFPQGIYPGKKAIFSWLWFQSHYGYNPFNYHPGVLLRRQYAHEAGGFDQSMIVGGDIDLFLVMLEQGDLAILDTIACDITVHAGQESCVLKDDGGLIKDLFSLNQRYKNLLDERKSYSRIMHQTSAIALGMAIKFFMVGHRDISIRYWKLARANGSSVITVLIALAKLVALRALLKVTGFRMTQLPSPLSLKPPCGKPVAE